jgi:hypothetical protein
MFAKGEASTAVEYHFEVTRVSADKVSYSTVGEKKELARKQGQPGTPLVCDATIKS